MLKYGGAAAYQKLKQRHTKISQKIVLLTHDIAFRTPSKAQFFKAFSYILNEGIYLLYQNL